MQVCDICIWRSESYFKWLSVLKQLYLCSLTFGFGAGVLHCNISGAEAAGQPGAVPHLRQLQREPAGAAHPARLQEAAPVHLAQPCPAGQEQPLLVAHPGRQQVSCWGHLLIPELVFKSLNSAANKRPLLLLHLFKALRSYLTLAGMAKLSG